MSRYLGLDLGTKNCGIAISDKTNIIACPLKTIRYRENDYDYLANEINEIIKNNDITDLILGNPKNMDGSSGFATKRGELLLEKIENKDIKIHLIDERLSTVYAQNILHDAGKDIRKSKKIIDTLSACLILETFMKKVENGK